jgi:hypothetical protein
MISQYVIHSCANLAGGSGHIIQMASEQKKPDHKHAFVCLDLSVLL